MTIDEMKESLVNTLTPYLKKTDAAFDDTLLSSIVDGVLVDAKQYRRYPASYSEAMILADMENGLGTFRRVALARYNMIGVENETSHSEGDVSRHYNDYGKEWDGWLPFAVIP